MSFGHRARRVAEGDDRLAELEHLALELEDALGVARARAGEHVDLDLVDVVLDRGDGGLVAVDDVIGDGQEDLGRADGQSLRLALEQPADLREVAAGAVAHGDDGRLVDEQHHLAELEDLVAVDVAGGLEHDEDGVAVAVELGALVGMEGVLDGEGMEVPELGHLVELGLRRVGEADPREAPFRGPIGGGLGQVRRAGPPDAAVVHPDVDDHRSIVAHRRRRCGCPTSVVARVPVRRVHRLRLRGPARTRPSAELALPVLERGLAEVARRQVRPVADRSPPCWRVSATDDRHPVMLCATRNTAEPKQARLNVLRTNPSRRDVTGSLHHTEPSSTLTIG